MRKMLAVGAAIALCVGLGMTSTVGHDEVEASADAVSTAAPIEMRPATVTGEEVCSSDFSCEENLSDPRVSGTSMLEYGDEVITPGGYAFWGTVVLTGPEGRWSGPWVGHQISQSTAEILGILEGSEAYEGWTFIVEWSGPLDGSPLEVKGVIYEGSAPRMELPS